MGAESVGDPELYWCPQCMKNVWVVTFPGMPPAALLCDNCKEENKYNRENQKTEKEE